MTKGPEELPRWEYFILTKKKTRGWSYELDPEIVPELNQLGQQGWELVAMTAENGTNNNTVSHSLVFKRRSTPWTGEI